MKKTIVLLVSKFPFKDGESFLENELKIIHSDFEKIFIIPKSYSERSTEKRIYFEVPNNVEIINLRPVSIYLLKIISLKYFFNKITLLEIFRIFFKYKVRSKIESLKDLFSYLIQGHWIKKSIIFILKNKKLNKNDLLFYSYWCDESTFALASLKKKRKINSFILRIHSWDLYFERHKSGYLPFRPFIFEYSNYVLPISNHGLNYLINKGLITDNKKLFFSRLGVSDIHKKIVSKKNNAFHILTISHLNPVKRLDRLVDALYLIDDIQIYWSHIGWGYPDYEDYFYKTILCKIKVKQNIKTNFLGKLSTKEVKTFLSENQIDLFVNSSEYEGIPVSIMEAFSAGIPAIGFDVGGISEIIANKKNGLLMNNFEGKHVDDIKSAILYFANLDYDLYRKYSVNAKETWLKKYNVVENYNNFSSFLKKI